MLFSHMHNILYFIDIGFQLSKLGTTFQAAVER